MAQASVGPGSKSCQVSWTLTDADPSGDRVNISEYPSKTVEVSGGPVRLIGTNTLDGDGFDITDVGGFPIKGPGLYHVTINPLWIWPVGSGVVTILATKTGGL